MRSAFLSVIFVGVAAVSWSPGRAQAADHGLGDSGRCMEISISTLAINTCYEKQIAALDKRLPAGSEGWKKKMEEGCHTPGQEENDAATMGIYECEVKATAKKVHAS